MAKGGSHCTYHLQPQPSCNLQIQSNGGYFSTSTWGQVDLWKPSPEHGPATSVQCWDYIVVMYEVGSCPIPPSFGEWVAFLFVPDDCRENHSTTDVPSSGTYILLIHSQVTSVWISQVALSSTEGKYVWSSLGYGWATLQQEKCKLKSLLVDENSVYVFPNISQSSYTVTKPTGFNC